LALKYFVEAGAMAVRRVAKKDLRQIAKATGAQVVTNLSSMEDDGEEVFTAAMLGTAEWVTQEFISDKEVIVVRGTTHQSTSSIILRGPNDFVLDEMERAIHDTLCIVRDTLESPSVVPGGGAVEAALSIYLENFANTLGTREQLAVAQYAEALLCIPRTLAVNAALDSTDLVAKLRAHHNAAQTDSTKRNLKNSGLDLVNGKVCNSVESGVLEPAMSKVKSLQFATEAAITILRIDDMIKLVPKEEPKRPHH